MSRLDQLRKLAAAEPNDPLAHYGVGLECMNLERWEEARTAFERTLTIDANYTAALFQKARAELKLGQRDTAAATLQAGLALATQKGETHAADEMRKMLEALA
jgi:tetratricopeptide (TPR) repeat protein